MSRTKFNLGLSLERLNAKSEWDKISILAIHLTSKYSDITYSKNRASFGSSISIYENENEKWMKMVVFRSNFEYWEIFKSDVYIFLSIKYRNIWYHNRLIVKRAITYVSIVTSDLWVKYCDIRIGCQAQRNNKSSLQVLKQEQRDQQSCYKCTSFVLMVSR